MEVNNPNVRVLEVAEWERMVAAGELSAGDPVTLTIPAEEYIKRKREGTLPNQPIMQLYDLRPYLEDYRRIEEEERRREAERSVCGRLRRLIRDKHSRVFPQ